MGELLLSDKKGVKTYLVENSQWGANIIMKVLDDSFPAESTKRKFNYEFKLLKTLDIKGIRKPVGLESIGDKPRTYYEYFDGFSLKKLVENGKNDLSLAIAAGLSLLNTLSILHENRVIHKNINSNNILHNTKSQEFCLIDFSNASTIKEKKSLYGGMSEISGEIEYISPEQTGRINRSVDHRSDLYSLGIVLYEIVTGRLPFSEKSNRESIYGHVAILPEPPIENNPSVPAALSKLIMKLLEKDADDRYQSSTGVAQDLQRIQQEFINGKNTDFELAEYDRAKTLTLSQKLYGRDKEINELNSHLQEVALGGFGVDMVVGYSGSGKSALVNEAFKALAKTKGYFLSGKFDQLQRNIPYYAIRQALKQYFEFLLTEDGTYIDQIRQNILANVGSDSGLLIEIFPELEYIIGRQHAVEKAAGLAAQNRFNYALGNFLRAITEEGRPIVLFIDDLQWADLASLNLISYIINDRKLQYFLLVGSYRENEVSETHPVAQLIQQCEKDGIIIQQLSVENLSQTDIINLLSDSLSLPSKEVEPLSKILYKHTDGNAFYTTQIIQSLYEQGKLFFDESHRKWVWDNQAIQGVDIPENIIELMIQRIRRMDQTTQELLQKGSCFGNRFALTDLEYLLDVSAEEFEQSLISAQEEGYIHGEDDIFYFSHDRIQQAVYALIANENRNQIHFEIGLQLLKRHADNEEKIFEIVDQINFGVEDVVDNDDRIKYAKLNLQAGRLAKSSTAYDAAVRYFETGINFVKNDWLNEYDLVLALHTNYAEAAYLLGRYDKMDEEVKEVLGHARELLEKVSLYKLEIEALKSQNDLYSAVEKGLEVLDKLNVKLPYKPSQVKVFKQLISTRLQMAGKNPNKLLELKRMKDPYMIAAMQVLVSIGPAIYWASPNLTPLTIFKMLLISVKYGNTDESTFAYSTYGLLLCGVTGEIKLGNAFGQLALDLSQKVNPINKVKGVFNVYCFVHHWQHPLTDSFKPFKEAHLLGLEAGDLEFSALSAYLYCNHSYYAGVPLPIMENDFKAYSEEIKRIQQFTSLNYNLIHWQAAYNLSHETSNPTELNGPVYEESNMLPKHLEANDKTALFKYYLQKMILNYLFGNLLTAYEQGIEGAKYIDAVTGMYVTVAYNFYFGLVLAGRCSPTDRGNSKALMSQLSSIVKKMKKWALASPVNNQHKLELLQAEYHRVSGKPVAATNSYKKATRSAEANSFLNEQALAYELAGKFYVELKETDISNFYLTNAYITYEKWGAKAKCKELLYSHKLDAFIDSFAKSLNKGFSLSKISTLEKIDIGTITEVSETISDEIDYDQLKQLLLKMLAENAGAEKAILFLVKNKITSLEDSWPDHRSSTQTYAATIVEKALNTGDIVVTERAQADIYFKQDEHVKQNNVRSALCLPLYHRNELIAIIYLENNVIYGAFSPNRLELLKLLSGQIAISLKNATLYRNLAESYDHQVELKNAYSKFVPMDFLEFLGKESILDVTLGDQIQVTATIMFIDIVDYTTLSEQMTPKENFDFINGALHRLGPVMRKFGGVISQFLGDGAMAIFKDSPDNALRAAIGIQHVLIEYNAERTEKKRIPIGIGVGIHTGKVMLGIIGEKMRMDQNIISDNVNIASRVQDLTRIYNSRVLFTGSTMKLLETHENFKTRYLGKTKIKGRENDIAIYECIDAQEEAEINLKSKSLEQFNEAIEAYYNERHADAIKGLNRVLAINPGDQAAKIFLSRAEDDKN